MHALRSFAAQRAVRETVLTVLLALVVLEVTRSGRMGLARLVEEAIVVVVLVVLVVRNPVAWAAGTIVYVPLQLFVLSALWSAGMPAAVCRGLGFVKEGVIVGLLVTAVLRRPAARRLTGADKAVLGLVLLVAFYFVMPVLFPGSFGGQTTSVRLAAVRTNLMFFLFFLALRQLRLTARDLRIVENAALAMGLVLAVGGFWELITPSNYNHVLTQVVRLPAFTIDVLHGTFHGGGLQGVLVYNSVGSASFVRNGSLLADENTLAFILIVPLLIGLRRLLADGWHWWVGLTTVGVATILLDTLTRSAIVAAALGILVLLAGAIRRRERGALLISGVVAAVVLVSIPFVGSSSVGERITGAFNGTDQSTAAHQTSTSQAFFRAIHRPLGLGLGADTSAGQQQSSTISVNAEDAYLQVSLELGWLGLALFLAAYVAGLRDLRSIVRRGPPHPAAAALAAGLGLAFGCLLLPIFAVVQTPIVFWGFAGACCGLGATEAEDARAAERAETRAPARPPRRATAGALPMAP